MARRKTLFRFLVLALLFSSSAEARFYAPGLGDPHRDGPSVAKQYTIERKVETPRAPAATISYRVNQQQMHAFAAKARNLPLPADREIELGLGQKIRDQFSAFLNPANHKIESNADKIELAKIGKPPKDPNFTAAERHHERAELLLAMLAGDNRSAATRLWKLANIKDSTPFMRSRDALFSGLAAERQGWESVAMMAFDHAIDNGLGRAQKNEAPVKEKAPPETLKSEPARTIASTEKARIKDLNHYTQILLQGIASIDDEDHLDQLVDRIDASYITSLNSDQRIDRALFSLAKTKFATDGEKLEYLEGLLSENSQYRERLQLLRALGMIEERKHKAALQVLKNLASSTDPQVNEKARVNLARLLAIFSQYDQALNIYRTIPIDSLIRLDSLMEIAWLEFENGQYQYSLGKSVGLQTQFYFHAFVPEVYILEAYSRKNMCDFGGAEASISAFKQDYTREIEQLRDLVREKAKNKSFSMYGALKDAFRAQDTKRIRRFERYLLQVPAINNRQMTLHALQTEHTYLEKETLAQILKDDQKYMQDRAFLTSSLDRYYQKKREEFAPIFEQTIYEELKYLDRKLLALFQQVEFLNLDISAAADTNQSLQAALNYPEIAEQEPEEIGSHQERWPFEDKEFWEDEIAWLKSTNPSKCVPKSNDDLEVGPLADARGLSE